MNSLSILSIKTKMVLGCKVDETVCLMPVWWIALSFHTHDSQTLMGVCICYASETSVVPDEVDIFVESGRKVRVALKDRSLLGAV